ncbi:enoyl-ACP reductase FabV [Haloplasma contractile]|uniref:Enoyl-[acyl-carrier-protein] reductase [NADH] n=1 Tax=Haloplasma contractile SSD-17B TaxID=1033810 RepID=U2DTM3_9MOLU|nr:enoyl-ACP reductase FabV [Haloplasma contractile]ERJ11827.1 trans-2-enoyl-CoA reductase protein [Haloplasma contractile SSD-17B]
MTEDCLDRVVIKPRLKGNISRTSHPYGCKKRVEEQIDYVKEAGKFKGPKKILILGASSSYGLASRITLAFGCDADTIGVSYERGITNEKRLATAGWWNNIFFKQKAEQEGLVAKNFIGDAFSNEMKDQVIDYIKTEFGGQIDLLIYSLAAPKRKDPKTDIVYTSALKPIDEVVIGHSINLENGKLFKQIIEPATDEEIKSTIKVMGGEDWELWIDALEEANVLSEGFKTTLYSYVGPDITKAFYGNGTLGRAKRDAEQTSDRLNERLKNRVFGESIICCSKAVTTKASAVIPIFPLYASALYRVMAEKDLHETPIMHKYRFFKDMLYGNKREYDEQGRLRPDSWELREDVQEETKALLKQITPLNFKEITAFNRFKDEFMQLSGFNIQGLDYEQLVNLEELKDLLP